ncbi:MAG: prepilin peptidase, partial [Acidimicrobiia bacterium]
MGAVIGLAAVLGLAVGTFVDVVISRVPAKQPLVLWRRRCPDCVRRRWVEVACAGLFAAAAARFGWSWALPGYLVLFAALLAISVIDLEHYIVPDRINVPLMTVAVPLLGLAAVGEGEPGAFVRALLAGVGSFGFLFALNIVNPRGMGMGDVKL